MKLSKLLFAVLSPAILPMLLTTILVSGCVHVPSLPANAPGSTRDAVSSLSASRDTLTPNPALQTGAKPSTVAIQHTVNWFAGLTVIGGLALMALAGFLGYGGQIVPAIKVGLAGILLPIFGIWFAYHWLAVVIISLLCLAGFFVATHFSIVKPLLLKIQTEAEKVANAAK